MNALALSLTARASDSGDSPGAADWQPEGCTQIGVGTVAAEWASQSAHWAPAAGLWIKELYL